MIRYFVSVLTAIIVPVGWAQAADQNCHPSYANVCVPIASDVDCAGGSGNGPAYVVGPVKVVGPDVYRLDRDGDGIACEPKK
ncbi:MAG: excalibur calcium-binding domain-containing protein [Maritimibacter sp.]|jgi:resuscitation-promoting factor RpfB